MAHLKTQQTRNDAVERKKWKYTLMRQLYEQGYSNKDSKDLIAFVDWIMYVPEELDKQCWQDIHDFEQTQHMPYVTSIERIGIKKGFEQGFQQGIEEGIEQGMQQGLQQGMQQGLLMAIELVIKLRFGSTGADVLSEIRNIDDTKTLQTILEALETATTLDEVRSTYATEQRW